MFRPRSKPYPPVGAVHRQADAEASGIARDAVCGLRALAGVEALAAAEARALLRRRRVVAERAVDARLAVIHVLAGVAFLTRDPVVRAELAHRAHGAIGVLVVFGGVRTQIREEGARVAGIVFR